MRWIRQRSVIYIALAFSLAACGGNGAGGDAGGQQGEVAGELTFWDTSDPANEAPAFKELIARFEERYPKGDVVHQSVPFGDAQNKFKTAAAAGTGAPDILRAEVAWVPEFASLGYLQAIDGTALLEDEADYLPIPMSSNKFDGRTYGVPQVTDSLALMYNRQLLRKAGISQAPTTWGEVAEAARALRDQGGADGIYINAGGYFLLPFVYGEGGDLVDAEARRIVVNSDANVRGVTVAQELIASGAAVKPPANDPYGTMMTLFKEQKVGMILTGPWELKNIAEAPKFGGLDNLGIAPVPAGSVKAGAPVGGHNYVVWSGMPQEESAAAVAFISFMNSAESQAFLADELGLLPTRQSAYKMATVADNPTISAFKPVMDAAVARPWIPEGGKFFTALDEMAVKVLVQDADPRTALDQVAKAYKADVVPDYTLY